MTQGAGQGPAFEATVSWRPVEAEASPPPAPGQAAPPPLAPAAPFPHVAPVEPLAPGAALTPGAPGTAVAGQMPIASAPFVPGVAGDANAAAGVHLADGVHQLPTAPPPGYAPTQRDTQLVPPDYTPTQRDLPVIAPTVALDDQPAGQPAPSPAPSLPGPLYVVGDVHGYLDELCEALRAHGLIDAEGHWSAGSARLWFLGDFTDRGPDGIGVIELVMQLSAEAAAAGGYAKALMGNHELLLLGAHRFGDTPVNSTAGTASFLAAWRLNGGQPTDMERLEDRHLTWISRLDAAALVDGYLLLHSDTTAYLDYGTTIDAMNDAVTGVLQRGDADECWDLFRKFTKRFAFRGDSGGRAARELLDTYGGHQVVHGHSPIPYLLGEVGGEYGPDGEERTPVVDGPMVYADNLAVAMDGGVTMEGRLLVAQLPFIS